MTVSFDQSAFKNQWSIKISKILFLLVLLLFLLHCSVKCIEYFQGTDSLSYKVMKRLFDLDGENTIPAWFSACLLWTSGLCLCLIGYLKRDLFSKYWYVLSISFVYLSIDESLSLHEAASRAMRKVFEANSFTIPHLYNLYWTLPAGFLVFILLLFLLPLLRTLCPTARHIFVFAGFVYISGAIGLELLGGYAANMMPLIFYEIIFPLEEVFELAGIIIFLHGLTSIIISKLRIG